MKNISVLVAAYKTMNQSSREHLLYLAIEYAREWPDAAGENANEQGKAPRLRLVPCLKGSRGH